MRVIVLNQNNAKSFQVNVEHIVHWTKNGGKGSLVLLTGNNELNVMESPGEVWQKIDEA